MLFLATGTPTPRSPYIPFERTDTMYPIDPIYTANMNDQQRAWFYAEYERARKDEVIGVLLAILLGGFGVHHFYLRRDGLGILYLIFSWTGIPTVVAWIEAFFMPSRVRQYNASQATYISTRILAIPTGSGAPSPDSRTWASTTATKCNACGSSVDSTATFCTHCGAAINHSALSTQSAV
jgi:TM2 domain-containing membrane protein YozV